MSDNRPIELKMRGQFRLEKEGISIDGVSLEVLFKRLEGREVSIKLKTEDVEDI